MTTRADDLIQLLGLRPHPEGGHYGEVHRSEQAVAWRGADRSALTTIHFLLAAGEVSRWHVLAVDEVWHLLQGEPLELLTYDSATDILERVVLGPVLDGANRNPWVVRAGVWQAARPLGDYALAGCTVGPGFDFQDFRFVRDLPEHEAAFGGSLAPFRDLL